MSNLRRLVKILVHIAIDTADWVRRRGAEAGEHWSDLMAEVDAEREADRQKREAEQEAKIEALRSVEEDDESGGNAAGA